MGIHWDEVFTSSRREPPATGADVKSLLDDLRRPVSAIEIETLRAQQSNPYPSTHPLASAWQPVEPASWRLPGAPLPPAYLSFLAWSNGGAFMTGRMEFGFFGTGELRGYLLGYHLPEYMPMVIPLGLDGSGNFAVLDAREPLRDGEFPVLVTAAGNLGFDDARPLAPSFELFCRRTERVEDALRLAPVTPPPRAEMAEREARLAAFAARRDRERSIDLADAAFRAGDFGRVSQLLAPYRGTLVGSVEARLRIAEKKVAKR